MNRVFAMVQQRPWVGRSAAAVLAVCLFTACQAETSSATAGSTLVQASQAAVPQATLANAPAGMVLPNFAALVEQHGPAVVNISTKGKRVSMNGRGMSPGDPFYEFFRRFGMPAPGPRGMQPEGDEEGFRRPGGEGSGFIVSADGYILTNAHVVDDADEVTVKLTDRREFIAKIVGLDKPTDVAVLKIDAKDLPTVRIGDPRKLRPGEWVLAIGSPFGFDNTATAGIVSATARGLPGGDSNYVNFIQTDVAVNPGNSGGPLFNLAGEVVGINSQIYSRSGGYMGISFAIPIDVAVDVRDQIIAEGRVSRGKIGVSIQQVDAALAESFGLDRPRGALVGLVESEGPADKAGLRQGDIILAVDGRLIERSEELPTVIGAIRPGNTAVLEVWRDRKARKVSVKVVELEPAEPELAAKEDAKPESKADRLGLVVRELTDEEIERARAQRERRGLDPDEIPEGLLVERAQGAARDAGVQRGDFILNVNGKPVKSAKEFRDEVAKGGSSVALLVQRRGVQIFIPVRTR